MMRRQIKLMGWLFVSALAACTSETPNPADGGNAAENVQKLVINLSDGGDRLTTRAGRPLHSSEPGQWIQNVTLYVTNEKGIVLQKEIDEYVWANAVDYSNGKQLEIAFRASDGEQLPENEYTVYAVAFSNSTDYSILPAPKSKTKINAINNGSIDNDKVETFDFQNEFSAILNSGVADAEEIFAGVATIVSTKDSDGKPCLTAKSADDDDTPAGNAVITLNRQVAGTIGYFTNIPASVNGVSPTHIRLVASNRNNTVGFFNMLSGETVTSQNDKSQTYVVNGTITGSPDYEMVDFYNTPGNKGYVVYEINLEDFFPYMKTHDNGFAGCDLDDDGYVGYKDVEAIDNPPTGIIMPTLEQYWTNPGNTEIHPQSLVKGSVYGSGFMIPFRWKEMYNTFELQLLGKGSSGEDVFLKAWNVKINENQLNKKDVPSVSTGVIVTVKGDKSTSCFNVYRNHMYSVGTKKTDGDGQNDYDSPTEDDKPADLSHEIELLITISTQWKSSDNMTLG